MPRVSAIQTNFTSGQLSPRIGGRVDIDRYNNGARLMMNAHPVIHGGAVRRAGTFFESATKLGAASASRLIEFIVNRDLAYMLEFGDGYVRVHTVTPYAWSGIELVSPYSAAMLEDIDWVQGADTMFLFHPSVAPYRIRNFSSTTWDLSAVPFTVLPFDEQGAALAANLTLSAVSGSSVTVTASAGIFFPSDVGRDLVAGVGSAAVTGYTSATVVTVNVSGPFLSTALPSGTWFLDVSPQAFLAPSAASPAGAAITLSAAQTRAATLTLSAKTGSITINASAGVFVSGDSGKVLYADAGVALLTYVSATQCTAVTSVDFLQTSYPTASWGVSGASAFRAADVGSYVRIDGGLAQITAVTSASQVAATILTPLTSIIAAPPLAWSMETPVWNATNGYPRTGTLHQQRLWAAGSAKFPQTIWGSRTGLYLDFTKGAVDSDACIFTIASDDINPISYLAANRDMLVHTYAGEFSMRSSSGKAITPTDVQITPESNHGSKTVRPLTIARESIYVQRHGRKVRGMSYAYQIDGYQSPDLTVMAEDITESGLLSITYQQEPEQILWGVCADGRLLSCTLDRDQNVTGWAQHITDGAFESVASVPSGDIDQVWAIMRRTVNGSTVRYIEVLDGTFSPFISAAPASYPPVVQPAVYGCTVDCGVRFDTALGGITFPVPHLVGKTVDILCDGAVQPQQVVPPSGMVTVVRPAYRTLIGLHFRSEIGLLSPEIGTGTGTAQGNSIRVGEITVSLLDTLGLQIFDQEGSEQEIDFRKFGAAVLDQVPPLFTGLVRIEKLGWERGQLELSIVQDQPLPMHVRAVVRKISVND